MELGTPRERAATPGALGRTSHGLACVEDCCGSPSIHRALNCSLLCRRRARVKGRRPRVVRTVAAKASKKRSKGTRWAVSTLKRSLMMMSRACPKATLYKLPTVTMDTRGPAATRWWRHVCRCLVWSVRLLSTSDSVMQAAVDTGHSGRAG